MNERREQCDADDIDEVCGELAYNENDLSFAEMLQNPRRKDIEQTGKIGDKRQNADTLDVKPIA